MPKASDDGTASALYGFAKELSASVDEVAKELRPLYHVENVADNVGELASAIARLASVTSLSVIATHGTDEDRAAVVAQLKRLEDISD